MLKEVSNAGNTVIYKIKLLSLVGFAGFCHVVQVQANFIDGLSVGENQTVTINVDDTAINVDFISGTGTLNNQGSATLIAFSDIFGTVNNFGLLVTKDITQNGKIINKPSGHIVMTGYIDMYFKNSLFDNEGKVSVVNAIGNGGNVGVGAPFTYLFRGPIRNSGSFLIDRSGGNICAQGGIGTITNSGVFEVTKNSICNFDEQPATNYSKSTYVQTSGESRIDGIFGVNEIDIQKGLLSGKGTIQGYFRDSPLFDAVTIAPGSSQETGTLTLIPDEAYLMCVRCSISVDLTGSANADKVRVNGTLYMNNWKLNVQLRDGYTPAPGSSFTVVSADSIYPYGPGPTYNLPKLPGSRTWSVQNTGTEVIITAN